MDLSIDDECCLRREDESLNQGKKNAAACLLFSATPTTKILSFHQAEDILCTSCMRLSLRRVSRKLKLMPPAPASQGQPAEPIPLTASCLGCQPAHLFFLPSCHSLLWSEVRIRDSCDDHPTPSRSEPNQKFPSVRHAAEYPSSPNGKRG
jgi:hypothetical protein